MNDQRRTIGTTGAAGRGGRGTSPSNAARSLAGGTRSSSRPVRKRDLDQAGDDPGEVVSTPRAGQSAAAAKSAATKKAATKKAGTKTAGAAKTGAAKAGPAKDGAAKTGPAKAGATKTAATKKAAATKKSASRASATPAPAETADKGPVDKGPSENRHQDRPRLRAVTDEDVAAAAASTSSGPGVTDPGSDPFNSSDPHLGDTDHDSTLGGLPLEEVLAAVVQAAQRVLGTDWEHTLSSALGAVRQRLSGGYAVDDFGFDPQIVDVLVHAVEPIAEKWFRLEVRGAENIPETGGALLVANHSGTVPLDGVMTGYAVKKYAGRALRPLGADLVFSLPFVGSFSRKLGATLACSEDAERLLSTGEIAGVWPEGFKGIGKPFSQRYRLQRFGRGGFVSSAMRAQVPIVPVSIVGAEEIYPLVGNVPSLARMLGLPYLPITPFFPLLGPLGLVPLPSKWIIEFGEPIRTDAYEPDAADDPMLLFNVTDQVRETIQQTLYQLLIDRGNAFL